MIKTENIDVFNFDGAIRGMRNPLNSWDKSDSVWDYDDFTASPVYKVGKEDLNLMHRLYVAGSEHRKYLRQIFVSMDVTAPLYWWKQMDQYRINTTTNSCSTMHKIHTKEFTLDDFSHEHLYGDFKNYSQTLNSDMVLMITIEMLNFYRQKYLETKDKEDWWQMIQLLPSSYNQKRTVTMNYENVVNMIKQREHHKLDEWNTFVKQLKDLPYIKEIMDIT